jgi:hemoglobin
MEDTSHLIYDAVGSEKPFWDLVEAFYRGIDTDPLIRPMYPKELTGAKERLALFLIQRFGGPTTYSDRRGHPRLRMRHVPFVIGEAERNAWLKNMLGAIEEVPELAPHRDQLIRYFTDSADFLINRPEVS